jgi:hypothetical protein
MTYYDPNSAPDPKAWLALGEQERMQVVKNFHNSARIKTRSIRSHAALHTIVENQIAQGYGPTRKALARLLSSGLSRHDALHAIGAVVARSDDQPSLNASLEKLAAKIK